MVIACEIFLICQAFIQHQMKFYCILFACFLLGYQSLEAQFNEVNIEVFDFDDGLSHRNVFKIAQDSSGFLWIATINGLNRFDGYEFISFDSHNPSYYLPHDVISDLIIDDGNQIWLANPNFITSFSPDNGDTLTFKIKKGEIARRESRVPTSLYLDQLGKIWMSTFDEKTAENFIQSLSIDMELTTHLKVPGNYTKRPIIQWGQDYYVGASENELWHIDEEGQLIEKVTFPVRAGDLQNSRIVSLLYGGDRIWVLLMDGRIYSFFPDNRTIIPHDLNLLIPTENAVMTTFMIESDGDIWVGGRDHLWFFDRKQNTIIDYNEPIFQQIKNTCTYRQIFKDKLGVIWIASDFGLIKLSQPRNLFYQYLEGGSEYCSNVYCSIRGITENEAGQIYVSHYNSIHVIDPIQNTTQLLFPANDFYFIPFGITHHDNHIYTGNGLKIDLTDLSIDTLFPSKDLDLGAVMVDRSEQIWHGYEYELYQYNPRQNELTAFEDQYGTWDTTYGIITHLYQSKNEEIIWVSTMNNGVHKIHQSKGRIGHFHSRTDSPVKLNSDQVNAVYEDDNGSLWLATGVGLHQIVLEQNQLNLFTIEDGLPNNYINGILPEGDSSLWISTDYGLSRFDLQTHSFKNFNTQDGLSANEFNRMSFYKAKDGRLYFGGLDGVNAFYPSDRFLGEKQQAQGGKLMFTEFSKFDGRIDSLFIQKQGLSNNVQLEVNPWDKFFTIGFSLANFEHSEDNQYSFFLQGYETTWSPASKLNTVRFNDIPAGNYTFRLRGRTEGKDWLPQEIELPIKVREAFYRKGWFFALCGGIFLAVIFSFMRYRIYRIQKHEQELQKLVDERTHELYTEKQKSEELLLNILPVEIAEELKVNGVAKAKRHELVTVMFSDFKSFTKISEKMDPEQLVAEIDWCFRAFDKIIEKHHLEKIKTIGDAYLCVGGIAGGSRQDAINIIQAAIEIQAFLQKTAKEKSQQGRPFFEARIGIHTGPIVAGIVGIKKFAYDIWGDTVNIASRMETNGQVGKVNISETTFDLIKDHYHCIPHRQHQEPERAPIQMYFVEPD